MNTPSRKTSTAYVCPISEASFSFDPGSKQSRTDAASAQFAHTAAVIAAQDGETPRDWSVAERASIYRSQQ